jgi:hypothetical protein
VRGIPLPLRGSAILADALSSTENLMRDPLDRDALRETWLARLETGFYPQGYDALASCDHAGEWQYCPLGAACELFLERGGLLPVLVNSQLRYYDGESTFLPETVREAFGFRSVRGTRGSIDGYKSLTVANDSKDLSLPQLARLIRDHFDLVFEV